jgi:hypothetical protein
MHADGETSDESCTHIRISSIDPDKVGFPLQMSSTMPISLWDVMQRIAETWGIPGLLQQLFAVGTDGEIGKGHVFGLTSSGDIVDVTVLRLSVQIWGCHFSQIYVMIPGDFKAIVFGNIYPGYSYITLWKKDGCQDMELVSEMDDFDGVNDVPVTEPAFDIDVGNTEVYAFQLLLTGANLTVFVYTEVLLDNTGTQCVMNEPEKYPCLHCSDRNTYTIDGTFSDDSQLRVTVHFDPVLRQIAVIVEDADTFPTKVLTISNIPIEEGDESTQFCSRMSFGESECRSPSILPLENPDAIASQCSVVGE